MEDIRCFHIFLFTPKYVFHFQFEKKKMYIIWKYGKKGVRRCKLTKILNHKK